MGYSSLGRTVTGPSSY